MHHPHHPHTHTQKQKSVLGAVAIIVVVMLWPRAPYVAVWGGGGSLDVMKRAGEQDPPEVHHPRLGST
jgi:hypothetical protein